MMRFLVLSDSHRNSANVNEAISRNKNADAILFLGDGLGDITIDLEAAPFRIPVYSVRGNCDFFLANDAEDELLLHFEEYTVLMMHGHRFGVKSSLSAAAAYAAKKGADILLFGHTHVPTEKYLPTGEEICGVTLKKPLYLFNPGSVGERNAGHYSFGTMTLSPKGVLFGHGKI